MPLIPLPSLLESARAGRYAVGYFESWDLESLQAVIDAAEACAAPVIVGFNGEFLANPERVAPERLSIFGAAGRAACEAAAVPCSLIFNECPALQSVYEATEAGFNVVMYVDPDIERETLIERVRALTAHAHARDIGVEAEFDELPMHHPADQAHTTDPVEAAQFVDATGVDALAVSVGNVHIMTDGNTAVDADAVTRLADAVPVYLVLHGGTGVEADSLREAVAAGITKVNYGTVLKQAYLRATTQALEATAAIENPHDRLGSGRPTDIQTAGRAAVTAEVVRLMDGLGCCGQVDL